MTATKEKKKKALNPKCPWASYKPVYLWSLDKKKKKNKFSKNHFLVFLLVFMLDQFFPA